MDDYDKNWFFFNLKKSEEMGESHKGQNHIWIHQRNGGFRVWRDGEAQAVQSGLAGFRKIEERRKLGQNSDRGPPITVLFVPATPNGTLAKNVQAQENTFAEMHKLGLVKVIERVGNQNYRLLWQQVSLERARLQKAKLLGLQQLCLPTWEGTT